MAKSSQATVPSENPKAKAIVDNATRAWKQSADTSKDQRQEQLTDLQFLNLDQWPANIKALRNQQGQERPCLTLDQLSPPWRQLVSQQQRANAAIRVVPEQGDANRQTADMTQGLIRAIEYQSDAKTVYGIVYAGTVGPGLGYLRIRSEYESPLSFDQRIVMEAIENPFAVYPDESAKMPDRSDARFYILTEDVPTEKYNERFPQSKAAQLERDKNGRLQIGPGKSVRMRASLNMLVSIGDEAKTWFPDGAVRIAEYYWVDEEIFEIVEIAGEVFRVDDKTIDIKTLIAEAEAEGEPVQRRQTRAPVVKWALINAIEILEGAEPNKHGEIEDGRVIPGTTIPIRPCYGEVLNVDGKRTYRGIIRGSRDAQQQYNYQNSAMVEDLALAPKPPVMGVEGQFEGHEDKWEQANTRAFPYLEYAPVSLAGTFAPAPSRPMGVDPSKIAAMTGAIAQAKSDLRNGTSWYSTADPSQANSEQSGKAIRARKLDQEETGFAFQENFRRLLISVGKLLLEWIPAIYDREGRIVQVLGLEEGAKPEWAMIKSPFTRDAEGRAIPAGDLEADQAPALRFEPQKGVYGVRVTIGASHETRKQQAADALGRLIEAHPPFMQVFGDLYVRNLDIPDANEIADRIQRTIRPEILGEPDDAILKNLPPEVQTMIQQGKQQIEQLTQQLQQASRMLETDAIKTEAQKEIAGMKEQAIALREQLKAETQGYLARMTHELDVLKLKIEAAKVQATIDQQGAQREIQEDQAELDGISAVLAGSGDAPAGPAMAPESGPPSEGAVSL